jgi:hypothetical protein
MKVKDLIQQLANEDPETRVVVDGYECGFDELEMVRRVHVITNSNRNDKHWEGEFGEAVRNHPHSEIALLLPRKS